MENVKEVNKPFILEIDEAKSEIIQAINNAIQVHKVPCYIVNMIISEIGAQLKEGAKQELEMAQQQIKE